MEKIKFNKKKRIEFRVDFYDWVGLKSKAELCGMNLSSYVRESALQRKLPKALNEEELSVYRDLKMFYSNFNSIKNLLKRGDHSKMIEEINELQKQLKLHLDKIL